MDKSAPEQSRSTQSRGHDTPAFAGSLNSGSRPSGGANPFAGNVGFSEGMRNFGANMRTSFSAGTFNAADGVGS